MSASTAIRRRPHRPHRGVIYTVAPSYLDVGRIWAGTDDGLIHVTADGGKTWKDVTPPELTPWAKVSIIDASHSNPLGAYAAVNTFRLDDLRPHIYRTRDGGATWTEITSGIPDGAAVNSVREDPVRKGLLFAATEQQVYFSIDDGDHWQSLRQNMPATSIRDLVVKDDDLVVATHGRGFWILDDITPLRQLGSPVAGVQLFTPARALRVRWNMNTDTPLPQEEPAGQNPPDGAVIDYYLAAAAEGPVTLEILDAGGAIVRKYSSEDAAEPLRDESNVPAYWIRPTLRLSTAAGMHRFVWDLHYEAPPGMRRSFPIAAVFHDTPREPSGPWAMPGAYRVRLTANGKSVTQPLTVRMDPRVKTPVPALQRQFSLSKQLSDAIDDVAERKLPPDVEAPIVAALQRAYTDLQDADVAPTAAAIKAAADALEGAKRDGGRSR